MLRLQREANKRQEALDAAEDDIREREERVRADAAEIARAGAKVGRLSHEYSIIVFRPATIITRLSHD